MMRLSCLGSVIDVIEEYHSFREWPDVFLELHVSRILVGEVVLFPWRVKAEDEGVCVFAL